MYKYNSLIQTRMQQFYICKSEESILLGTFNGIGYIKESTVEKETCISFTFSNNQLEVRRIQNSGVVSYDFIIDGLLGVYTLSNGFYYL